MTLAKRMQVTALALVCAFSFAANATAKAKHSPARKAHHAAAAKAKAKPAPRVDPALAARQAYYGGDMKTAMRLAPASNERWIAGLAAYRTKNYDQALTFFSFVAKDAAQDAWVRSGAAFWAARTASAMGQTEQEVQFTRLAATSPHTFYGMIAGRKLQLKAGAPGAADSGDPIGGLLVRSSFPTAPISGASAPISVGRTNPSPFALSGGDYPMPTLEPKQGFTIDRALVYAIVRQESRFNPQAKSHAGAVGLMQLMPEAAARAAGDDKLRSDMSPMYDPAMNLRVGQDYVTWLMERGVGYDLLRTVAAYNGGPGTLLKTAQLMGAETDSLLLIESLPARETRDYVEKVVAGYWAYRGLFGQQSQTLDALASGATSVDARLDR